MLFDKGEMVAQRLGQIGICRRKLCQNLEKLRQRQAGAAFCARQAQRPETQPPQPVDLGERQAAALLAQDRLSRDLCKNGAEGAFQQPAEFCVGKAGSLAHDRS